MQPWIRVSGSWSSRSLAADVVTKTTVEWSRGSKNSLPLNYTRGAGTLEVPRVANCCFLCCVCSHCSCGLSSWIDDHGCCSCCCCIDKSLPSLLFLFLWRSWRFQSSHPWCVRLFSNVVSPSSFRRSAYSSLFNTTSFVALLWACSRQLMSFLRQGDHASILYSRSGLT